MPCTAKSSAAKLDHDVQRGGLPQPPDMTAVSVSVASTFRVNARPFARFIEALLPVGRHCRHSSAARRRAAPSSRCPCCRRAPARLRAAGKDLHVAVRVRAETLARCDAILVDDEPPPMAMSFIRRWSSDSGRRGHGPDEAPVGAPPLLRGHGLRRICRFRCVEDRCGRAWCIRVAL